MFKSDTMGGRPPGMQVELADEVELQSTLQSGSRGGGTEGPALSRHNTVGLPFKHTALHTLPVVGGTKEGPPVLPMEDVVGTGVKSASSLSLQEPLEHEGTRHGLLEMHVTPTVQLLLQAIKGWGQMQTPLTLLGLRPHEHVTPTQGSGAMQRQMLGPPEMKKRRKR